MKKLTLVLITVTILAGGVIFYLRQPQTQQPTIEPPQQTTLSAPSKQDAGTFKIEYDETQQYSELQNILKTSKLFDPFIEDLNKTFALPVNIPVHFEECGNTNAYYDPESKQIIMCYELIRDIAQSFAQLSISQEKAEQATVNTTFFILYHEIGHALIHIYDLPTTGREEDNADQLATIELIKNYEDGEGTVLDGATWFFLRAPNRIKQLSFWDEHSLDKQRFYNIVCWIYGQNPQNHTDLVSLNLLPEERAARCEDEYQKIATSWDRLLSPHYKNP